MAGLVELFNSFQNICEKLLF